MKTIIAILLLFFASIVHAQQHGTIYGSDGSIKSWHQYGNIVVIYEDVPPTTYETYDDYREKLHETLDEINKNWDEMNRDLERSMKKDW